MSRWASTPRSTVATRNGSTPRLTSRTGAPQASLVCREESTRCPVSAAWAAIAVLMKLVDRIGFLPFALYRVALGLALLVFTI